MKPPPTKFGSTGVAQAKPGTSSTASSGHVPPPTKFGGGGTAQPLSTASRPVHVPPLTKFGGGGAAQAKAAVGPSHVPPPTKFGSGIAQAKFAANSGASPVHALLLPLFQGGAMVPLGQAPSLGAVLQPTMTIAGKAVTRKEFDIATNGFQARVKRTIRVAIASETRDFPDIESFFLWVSSRRGRFRKLKSGERAQTRREKGGYPNPSSGKIKRKHHYANIGGNKSKQILEYISKAIHKTKRSERIESEDIDAMCGIVTLRDPGTCDSTPFVNAKLSSFNHDKTIHKLAAKHKNKTPTSYVHFIHEIKCSQIPEDKLAEAVLADLDGKPFDLPEKISSYVKKALSLFEVVTQVSEEGRNPGAAKVARAYLHAIVAKKTTFLDCFSGNTALFTPAQFGGAGLFRKELKEDLENPKGDPLIGEYMSDSSDGEPESKEYDPNTDPFWEHK